MLPELLAGFTLLAICVFVHAVGLGFMLHYEARMMRAVSGGGLRTVWLLVEIAFVLVVLHLVAIAIWAFYFYWWECLPTLEVAFYFSGVTYATVGYGDVVLPVQWRLLGPMEGLTGILLCGLSTAFFFVVVTRIYHALMAQRSKK